MDLRRGAKLSVFDAAHLSEQVQEEGGAGWGKNMIPPQEAEAGGRGQARLLANTLTRSEDSVRPES